MAIEGGIWHGPSPSDLYMSTWVSMGNPYRDPLSINVRIKFDGVPVAYTRTYPPIGPGQRWSLNLDEAWANWSGLNRLADRSTVMASAVVFIDCDRPCAAEVARWYAPIGPGVVPSTTYIESVLIPSGQP